jgi:predicted amidohydrolase
MEFGGHSMIIEPGGNIIQEAQEEDAILISELSLEKTKLAKNNYPCNVKARLDVYMNEYNKIINGYRYS